MAITLAAVVTATVSLAGVSACGNREDPSKMKPIPTIGQPTPSPSNPADKGVDPSYKPKVIIGGSSFEADAFTFMAPENWIDAKADLGSDFLAAAKDGADFSGLPNFVYVFQLPQTPDSLKLLETGLPEYAKGWGVTNVRVQPRTTLGGRPVPPFAGGAFPPGGPPPRGGVAPLPSIGGVPVDRRPPVIPPSIGGAPVPPRASNWKPGASWSGLDSWTVAGTSE